MGGNDDGRWIDDVISFSVRDGVGLALCRFDAYRCVMRCFFVLCFSSYEQWMNLLMLYEAYIKYTYDDLYINCL